MSFGRAGGGSCIVSCVMTVLPYCRCFCAHPMRRRALVAVQRANRWSWVSKGSVSAPFGRSRCRNTGRGLKGAKALHRVPRARRLLVDGPGERNHPGRGAASKRCAMGRGRAAYLPVRFPKGAKALWSRCSDERLRLRRRARSPNSRNLAGVKRGLAPFAATRQKPAKRVKPPQGARVEVMNAHTLYSSLFPSLFLFSIIA